MSIIRALLSHSDASGSRSTILKPLTWLLGIILATLLAAFRFSAPAWFCYLLAGIAILAVLLFFFAYVFCLFKDRDALRSESFSLRKMEIEKGLYGDSDMGLIQRSNREIKDDYLLNSESAGEGI